MAETLAPIPDLSDEHGIEPTQRPDKAKEASWARMETRTRRETVGFIGLGRMGRPMATNLAQAGYELVVRDADRDVERQFAEENGRGGRP